MPPSIFFFCDVIQPSLVIVRRQNLKGVHSLSTNRLPCTGDAADRWRIAPGEGWITLQERRVMFQTTPHKAKLAKKRHAKNKVAKQARKKNRRK